MYANIELSTKQENEAESMAVDTPFGLINLTNIITNIAIIKPPTNNPVVTLLPNNII
jgi:hypothetical protein